MTQPYSPNTRFQPPPREIYMLKLIPSLALTCVGALSAGWALAADPDETPPVVFGETPPVVFVIESSQSPDSLLSFAGIGSLDWAAHHPAHGYKILLPIQPDDGSRMSADIREQCAFFTAGPIRRPACP